MHALPNSPSVGELELKTRNPEAGESPQASPLREDSARTALTVRPHASEGTRLLREWCLLALLPHVVQLLLLLF